MPILQNGNQPKNYSVYRQTWNHLLLPREHDYIHMLRESGVRRVAIFGTGIAARGLTDIFCNHGIEIVSYTSSKIQNQAEIFLGKTVLPLGLLQDIRFDRLMVASQFYFKVEDLIRKYDPLCDPIFPILA